MWMLLGSQPGLSSGAFALFHLFGCIKYKQGLQAALQTLSSQAVVLLGGAAKREQSGSLGFCVLAPLLQQHKVITFGFSAQEIQCELQQWGVRAAVCGSLMEAVAAARAAKDCASIGTVLLSPGGASFDEFLDFVDRGHKFTAYASGQL